MCKIGFSINSGNTMRRLLMILLLSSAAANAGGCCSICTYIKDRANDFADMFSAKVGFGLGLQWGFDACGLVSVHAGAAKTRRVGFEGRNFVTDDHAVLGAPIYNILIPTISLFRGDIECRNNALTGALGFWLSIISRGEEKIVRNKARVQGYVEGVFSFSTADQERWIYELFSYAGLHRPVPDPLSGGWRDYDLRFNTTLILFSFEIGFSFIELGDFILGIFTVDYMGDDTYPGPPPEPD